MTGRQFRTSDLPDPHLARRRAILLAHPEVRALLGPYRRTALWALAVVVGHVATAALFARLGSLAALIATAFVVGGFAAKFCGLAIHECAHDVVFRSRTANRVLALIANLPILAPGSMAFRRFHHQHHNQLGVLGVDNDLPAPEEIRWAAASPLRKLLWLTLFPLAVVPVRASHFFRRPGAWEIANQVLQVLAIAAIAWCLGGRALLYLALSSIFGFGLHPASTHLLHEHAADDSDQETYSYYGALNRLTYNVGYHVEHHDFQRIAGARLPELHRIAASFYDGRSDGRSWLAICWRFFFRPEVGYHWRIGRLAPRR